MGGSEGGGGEIYVRIVRGGEHEAHLGASGLLIGGDTHSSEPFITGHSGPPISSLIVSGPSLLSTCNCPHPLAFKGWQQTWPRGGGGWCVQVVQLRPVFTGKCTMYVHSGRRRAQRIEGKHVVTAGAKNASAFISVYSK